MYNLKPLTIISRVFAVFSMAIRLASTCPAQIKDPRAGPPGPEVYRELQRMYEAYARDVAPADRLLAERRFAEHEGFLRALEGKHPMFDGDVIYRIVIAYVLQSRWRDALVELDRLTVDASETIYLKGVCLGMSGQFDQKIYDHAMSTLHDPSDSLYDARLLLPPPGRPQDLVVMCALAFEILHGNQLELVMRFMRLALEFAPRNVLLNSAMHHLLLKEGHFLISRDHLQTAMEGASGDYKRVLQRSLMECDWYIQHKKK